MLDIRARRDARRPHGVRRSTTSRRAKASRDARHLVDRNAFATQDATCAFSLTTPERPVCSRALVVELAHGRTRRIRARRDHVVTALTTTGNCGDGGSRGTLVRPVGRVFSHTTCLARTRSRSTHLRSTRPHRPRSLAHVRKSEAAHTLALDAPALDVTNTWPCSPRARRSARARSCPTRPRSTRPRALCALALGVLDARRSRDGFVVHGEGSHLHTCTSQKPRKRSRSTHPRST